MATVASAWSASHPTSVSHHSRLVGIWPQEALRVRDFQVFGMEVLLNMAQAPTNPKACLGGFIAPSPLQQKTRKFFPDCVQKNYPDGSFGL